MEFLLIIYLTIYMRSMNNMLCYVQEEYYQCNENYNKEKDTLWRYLILGKFIINIFILVCLIKPCWILCLTMYLCLLYYNQVKIPRKYFIKSLFTFIISKCGLHASFVHVICTFQFYIWFILSFVNTFSLLIHLYLRFVFFFL